MKRRQLRWWAVSACLLHCLSGPGHAADLTGGYAWKQMKIGGGGWVVGMDIHPTEKGLMYCRTDVSGAYRWNPGNSTWKQIVTAGSMPRDYVGYGRYSGVESLVGAPGNPDIAYMAFKKQIFRSKDRGESWVATTFGSKEVDMDANGEGRQEGERLGVDPNNSDVVYYCPALGGVPWTTDDGGATWRKVEGVPAGKPPHGVNTIIFDRGSGVVPVGAPKDAARPGVAKSPTLTKTRVLYMTVNRAGVFRSSDGGATWINISAAGPGDAIEPRDAEIGPDRTYYLVCDLAEGAVGSAWKLSPEGTWTNITPGIKEGGNQSYADIAIDPADPAHVILMRNGGKCFESRDAGATWTLHFFHLNSAKIQWLGNQQNYWLSVGEIIFDPFAPGRLWFAEGFGVWWATNTAGPEVQWHAASEGIEEACVNELIAPPGGKPVAAMWDIGAICFTDPDVYNARRALPYFMAAWALDWLPADPKCLVGVFRNNLNLQPHPKSSGYSMDGGLTWTRFAAVDDKTLPADLEYGAMAVSARSLDHIVWAPAAHKSPWYTADRGATWKPASFGGPSGTGIGAHWSGQKPLCADRVQSDTFYVYRSQDGGFYRSTNGGANFARVGTVPSGRPNAVIKATPGRALDVWMSEGEGGGLRHTTDGGVTWTRIQGLQQCFNMGLGKAENEGGCMTLYVYGIAGAVTGIYRSTDEGVTWDKICGYPLGIFEWVDAIDGDKEIFGKVYLGFAQAGCAYGEIAKDARPK